jgi:carboxypeptidase N catalytic subunit
VNKKSGNGRFNANQFDLNRNFPSIYAKLNTDAEKNSTSARIKKSPNDSSNQIQPETATIMALPKLYPFVLSANLHSGALVVNYPYDDNAQSASVITPSPDDGTFKMLAKAYSMVI